MTTEEALTMGDRICNFLLSCGGAYTKLTGEVQENVFFALGSQQYAMKEENGEIIYFASFWKIHPADVEGVMDRIKPADLSHGSVVYVTEAANRAGRRGLAEMITGIRRQAGNVQGVVWHRPAKGDKIYHFPNQRGKEAQDGK